MKPDINIHDLFQVPLHDLGEDNPAFAGILTPSYERGTTKQGVTSQFLENAADYHASYTNVEYFRFLIHRALASFDPPLDPRVILDIGSGSGNSVIPLLDRFPDAFVVATDISPQLLAILRDYLKLHDQYRDRFALVCMDASKNPYRTDQFDLAVGAAILHHIIQPERVIKSCERALRPGGTAIFFEPFEVGHVLLSLAYREIIAEAERRNETSPGLDMLRHLNADYDVRKTRDKNDPIFLQIDDKWMFTRSFFEGATQGTLWDECRIYPINSASSPLTDQTRINLRLGMDADASALPDWAWKTLAHYESSFSPDARHDLIFEGTVVLRRTGALAADVLPRFRDEAQASGKHALGWWWNPDESGRGFFLEIRDEQICVGCFSYGEDAAPIWHMAPPMPLRREGEMQGTFHRLQISTHDDDASQRDFAIPFTLDFEGPRKARLRWGKSIVPLEPQTPENPGRDGSQRLLIEGWWIEDVDRPQTAIVVEAVEDRLLAAFLSETEWSLATAFRRRLDVYEGDWVRYSGGQTISGAYRPPAAPTALGKSRIALIDQDSLAARLPDGRSRVFKRYSF